MAGPDLTGAIRELHRDALAGLERALGRGTAMLVARVGDGERELIRLYDRDRPVVSIDATLFPDRGSLRFELLRSAVTYLLAAEPRAVLADIGPDGDAARLALAEAYGAQAGRVMAVLQREAPPSFGQLRLSLGDVLAGVEEHVPLVVFDAHRLDTDARWDLRELERPVLLVTRQAHYSALTSEDAPFYGHSQAIALRAPTAPEWMRALSHVGHKIQPTDLEWLLDRSRGRVATTTAALELKTPERSHRTAWHQAVQNARQQAHELLALARSVHVYAPSLLLAIAEGRRPYPAIDGAAPARIALALRKLRALDVIEQSKPRASQIADPLIEHAIQSLLNHSRLHDTLADTFDGD